MRPRLLWKWHNDKFDRVDKDQWKCKKCGRIFYPMGRQAHWRVHKKELANK